MSTNTPILDPKEAPQGYIAVLKSDLRSKEANLCRQCDWRKTCQDPATDLTLHNHRCVDYTTIRRIDGSEIMRHDGCSVVFKKIGNE